MVPHPMSKDGSLHPAASMLRDLTLAEKVPADVAPALLDAAHALGQMEIELNNLRVHCKALHGNHSLAMMCLRDALQQFGDFPIQEEPHSARVVYNDTLEPKAEQLEEGNLLCPD